MPWGVQAEFLDNILDVLACVEPCYDPPFQTIGPPLFERLSRLTTVVAVLQDWDPVREAFLRRVRECGVSVRALIVHDGPTSAEWHRVGEELGQIEAMSPAQVESAIAHGRPLRHENTKHENTKTNVPSRDLVVS